jgi:hypothetical protein
MARSDWRPCANLFREFFSCSTLTFATLFTAIERRVATSAQGAGFSYRAFGGISARKQAQAWTSTIVGLSADSGFALASAGNGNCWQSSHTCLCSDIADHTMNQATICSQRDDRHAGIQMSIGCLQTMAFNAPQAWTSCRDCVSAS